MPFVRLLPVAFGFAGVAAALFAQPAAGATARVDVRETAGGPVAALVYRAARGESNRVRVALEMTGGRPSAYRVRTNGITTVEAGCAPPEGDLMRCAIPDGAKATGPLLDLGDRNDSATITPLLHAGAAMLGGRGHDRLWGGGRLDGGRGNDRLQVNGQSGVRINGGPGSDTISGGPRADTIDPGPGNDSVYSDDGADRIRASDRGSDSIACGDGRDRALLDGFDLPFAHTCERIRRRAPPRAVPLSFFVDDENTGWHISVGCPSDMPQACVALVTLSFPGRGRIGRRVRIPPGERRDPGLDYDPSHDEETILARRGARVTVLTMLRSERPRVCRTTVPVYPFEDES